MKGITTIAALPGSGAGRQSALPAEKQRPTKEVDPLDAWFDPSQARLIGCDLASGPDTFVMTFQVDTLLKSDRQKAAARLKDSLVRGKSIGRFEVSARPRAERTFDALCEAGVLTREDAERTLKQKFRFDDGPRGQDLSKRFSIRVHVPDTDWPAVRRAADQANISYQWERSMGRAGVMTLSLYDANRLVAAGAPIGLKLP
jgi:hypothetical protein